jgi:hypothetical protein
VCIYISNHHVYNGFGGQKNAFLFATVYLKANDKTRITAAEMRFMRTVKYILNNYKRNDDILKELKTEPVIGKILKYKNNWIQHVNRMQTERIPKLLKNSKPRGRRNRGRPIHKRLDDETGTGQ